jgi:parallel beta-helix repeat protein
MNIRQNVRRLGSFISGVILTGSIFGAQLVDAATYYVATTGNDANLGTSSQPVKTIPQGISKLQSGDTLVIKPGTYAQRISNIPSGTSETNRTVIKAEQAGTVILKPSGAGHIALVGSSRQYITLEGLIIDGANTTSGYGLRLERNSDFSQVANHIILRNLEVRNTRSSCIGVAGHSHLLTGLYVHHCNPTSDSRLGVHGLYWSARDSILENTLVSTVSGLGIQLYDSGRADQIVNNILRNNIFTKAAKGGVTLYAYNNKIYNNVFYDNTYGLETRFSGNIIRNNIAYGNTIQNLADYGSGNTFSHNLVNSNPKFVNTAAGDFRLRSDSPAIDRGMALSEVPKDYAGVLRPQGAGHDIGAYEYKSTPSTSVSAPANLRIITAD